MTPATSLILGIIPFLITEGNAVPTVVANGVGVWSRWEPWSECSVTCGGGSETRTRDCLNPTPQNGDVNCVGDSMRTRECNTESCSDANDISDREHNKWSRWEPWSECSVTCGEGIITRRRTCLNPDPQNGDVTCVGDSMKSKECNTGSCTVDGNWGEWTNYTDCTASCGDSATKTRTRTCDNPAPRDGGKPCEGDDTQTTNCRLKGCPVHGAWSSWGTWSDCSVTCGDGKKLRQRSCNNPAPANGGLGCLPVDSHTDFESCTMKPCAINGGWSKWSAWDDSCSAEECNEEGLQIRIRSCSSPRPQHGGRYCRGNNYGSQECVNTEACPVNGAWGEWGAYGECTETCGDFSFRQRHKPCNNPAPRNNGKDCPDRGAEAQDCLGLPPCPTEAPASGDCADDEDADCEFSGSGTEPTTTLDPCSAFEEDYYVALCKQGDIDPPDVPGNEDPIPPAGPNVFDYSSSDSPQEPVEQEGQPAGNPTQEPTDNPGDDPDDEYSF